MRWQRLLVPLTALALASGVAGAADASARPAPHHAAAWAPVGTAAVHPGVDTYTAGAQCTANFVYTDGTNTYLGQAAHCSGTGASTETDGCLAQSLPEGTAVQVDGATKPGVMVYNSWIRMHATPEQEDAGTCAYNDLALIKLDPADVANTNPSVPSFGGPTGLRTSGLQLGDTVQSYSNSSLRFGLTPLSPKYGRSLGDDASGWSHTVYTVTPGIPGDSGSGFLDDSGKAFGILSTVAIAPLAGSNGVGDLAKELAYAQSHGFPGLTLVNGTEPFTGGI